jgi:hypothetical protein
MRGKVLWITVASVVLALSVASVAFAAVQDDSSAAPAPQTRGAACGALLDDPAAADELQALRTEHRTDMQAWFDKYGADRSSAEAQAALTDLRAEHQSEMQALLEKYGIDASLCTGSGMMGGHGGGMMSGGYGAGNGVGNGCGMLQTN